MPAVWWTSSSSADPPDSTSGSSRWLSTESSRRCQTHLPGRDRDREARVTGARSWRPRGIGGGRRPCLWPENGSDELCLAGGPHGRDRGTESRFAEGRGWCELASSARRLVVLETERLEGTALPTCPFSVGSVCPSRPRQSSPPARAAHASRHRCPGEACPLLQATGRSGPLRGAWFVLNPKQEGTQHCCSTPNRVPSASPDGRPGAQRVGCRVGVGPASWHRLSPTSRILALTGARRREEGGGEDIAPTPRFYEGTVPSPPQCCR